MTEKWEAKYEKQKRKKFKLKLMEGVSTCVAEMIPEKS
jgi:hypothetical protein